MPLPTVKFALGDNISYREYALMRFACHREAAMTWVMMGRIMNEPRYTAMARGEGQLARSYYRRIVNL